MNSSLTPGALHPPQIHEQFMNISLTPGEKGTNLPFVGGWVGFISYDLGTQFVGISQRTKRDHAVPEVYFAYCPKAYLIDLSGRCWFVDEGKAQEIKIGEIIKSLPGQTFPTQTFPAPVHEQFMNSSLTKINTPLPSNLTFARYNKKLKKIKEHLLNGDTYQVNFSQRFSAPYEGDLFELFQKISTLNPSPYQFFIKSEKGTVISNSPELLVKGEWKNGEMTLQTKPIKGTISRGKTPGEDEKNIRELLASKKEEAELAMIVDLERNDLGKVSVPGSVHVRDHRAIEKYSHVIHTVSTVESKLLPGKDVFDVLEAVFPGGSITGCPKKRTMEIIDQLEDFQRGIYCGSAGYISLNGNFEFNIMIRTMWHENGRIFFHSGGGIVADSDPKKEYEETFHKAKALTASLYYKAPALVQSSLIS